jgi:hypothetical protein
MHAEPFRALTYYVAVKTFTGRRSVSSADKRRGEKARERRKAGLRPRDKIR